MKFMTSILELIPGISNLSLTETVDEFSELMISQLDLRKEASALLKFRKNFECDKKLPQLHSNRVILTFPEPLPNLSFENVLFETFEEGRIISDYLDKNDGPYVFPVKDIKDANNGNKNKNGNNDIDFETDIESQKLFHTGFHTGGGILVKDDATRHALARAGLDTMLKMVFEDNFIHADLHMGNVIVKNKGFYHRDNDTMYNNNMKSEGEGLTVSVIDAGLIAELDTEDRRNFLDLFAAIIKNDGREVGRLMIERNKQHEQHMSYKQAVAFQDRLEEVVSTVHNSGMALGRMSLGDLLQKVLIGCYQNNVKLDSKFVSVMLAIGIVEGMGRRLDPDIDILKEAAPYIIKASAKFAAKYAIEKLHSAQMDHASRHPVTISKSKEEC